METTDLGRVRRRKAWRRRLLLATGLTLLVLGIWAVWFSPLLAVEKVTASGCHYADCAEVVRLAAVPPGTALASVSSAEVAAAITTLSEVKSVELRRVFPHELLLVVSERKPIATLVRDGVWQLVDATGVTFAKSTTRPADFLEVQGTTKAERAAAVTVAGSLQDWLRGEVASVKAESAQDLTVLLRDGRVVHWGDSAKCERKQEVLAALMQIDAAEYDISAPELPTTKG